MGKTYNALFARGIDSRLAAELESGGHTLGKLQQATTGELRSLGLGKEQIEAIQNGSRPPIPPATVIQLLAESRSTCCVCKTPGRPIIIHHLRKWSVSRDHSESNLVILCLEDHDQAHTQKELSLQLSSDILRGLKSKWKSKVEAMDATALLGYASKSGAVWDYINQRRVFELAVSQNIHLSSLPYYDTARAMGAVDENGFLIDPRLWMPDASTGSYFYDSADGSRVYFYVKAVLESVIENLPLIDITNSWERTTLKALIRAGSFFVCQGAHYFKELPSVTSGRNQTRRGYRQAQGISFDYQFDAWECTSGSARGDHLSGRRTVTSICHVRSVMESSENLHFHCSCLAIGGFFEEMRRVLPSAQFSQTMVVISIWVTKKTKRIMNRVDFLYILILMTSAVPLKVEELQLVTLSLIYGRESLHAESLFQLDSFERADAQDL